VRNGWLIVRETPWEYYFDTGLAGEAYVRLYASTGEQRFLEAALRAAAWADAQPLSSNWNYNAFIVGFFTELSEVTNNKAWLDRALERARFGVLPGMIDSGVDAGHFIDPHNERIAYRAIMARSLAQLAGALAAVRHPERGEIARSAQLATTALEAQMQAANGVASAPAMAELYAAIEDARADGAILNTSNPDLRSRLLATLLRAHLNGGIAPDSGVADAILLARGLSTR
jgi:hypothetical protein